jgi:hypothetical protein
VGEPPEFMRELVGREPPYARWFAAFDSTTHSVTVIGQYGDGERMAAGALDVCTDTWSPIDSDLRHPDTGETGVGSALVYDVDSDAMVAYTSEGVFVHDTALDEWQHHPVPRDDSGLPEHWVVSAAHHPASGLIIAADWRAPTRVTRPGLGCARSEVLDASVGASTRMTPTDTSGRRTMSTEISMAGVVPVFSSRCNVCRSSGQPGPGPYSVARSSR